MKKLLFLLPVAALCLFAALPAAHGQQAAHALSGTITDILPNLKMISVAADDGTTATFQWVKVAGEKVDFDKNLSADTTPVNSSAVKGDHVIVFYSGVGDPRTALALRDLGKGPLEVTSGVVLKLDKHEHQLTIKDLSGKEVSFTLDPKTIADTATGASENFHFDINKGTFVQVTAAGADGAPSAPTALLVAAAM